ncbi:type II secretion system protein GspL [Vibrio sp. PP-XX7]
MSEYLLVRLSNQPQTKVHWWIGSDLTTSVEKQGELASWEEVGELAKEVEQRPVIVLISGADVVLKEVTLPSGRARQFEKMLPYLVEDELAQDADTLHFSVLSKRGEQVFTAAIDQHWITTILAQFEAAGITVDKMLPDVLALPATEGASALQLGDEWLIRQGEFRGLCIENAWMPFFCRGESEDDEESPVLCVTCYSPKPGIEDNHQQVWTEDLADSVFSILLKGALTSPVTLLTGQFKSLRLG